MSKALLIGVKLIFEKNDYIFNSLNELKDLALTLDLEIVDVILVNRKNIDPTFYIGKGKLEEIDLFYCKKRIVDLIIFNNELSPIQTRNIENYLGIKVINRTELILEIFSNNARTKIAKLQVELAKLYYQLPRIIGKGNELSRLGGGIGTRGPGEKQLELDRRKISNKIKIIKERINKVNIEMETRRKKRIKNTFRVVIIGYTNAGKSTLINKLTKSNVVVKDKLFTTLDTTTKKLYNEKFYSIIITDTVGFIRDLPHTLIESFKSTLIDINYANLLVHLIDISSQYYLENMQIVNQTLEEIDAINIPIINCFNKIDKISDKELINLRLKYPDSIFISAEKKINLDVLKNKIVEIAENYFMKDNCIFWKMYYKVL